MEVRHRHFSSRFHMLATANMSTAVGPKNAMALTSAPRKPPCPFSNGNNHHHIGTGRHLPNVVEMDELREGQPLVHLDRQDLHFGEAAIPLPTVSRDRYAKTRASGLIWFIGWCSLSPREGAGETELRASPPRSACAVLIGGNGLWQVRSPP